MLASRAGRPTYWAVDSRTKGDESENACTAVEASRAAAVERRMAADAALLDCDAMAADEDG